MTTASPSLAKRLEDAKIVAPGSGTIYDIISGRRKPSLKLALEIRRATGESLGPIAGLSETEIAVLEKMHG